MTIKQHGGIFGRNPTFNNVEVDGEATLSSAKISDLTNNRVVIVGANGEIEDDANLSWDGSQFNISNGTVTLFVTEGSSVNAMRIGVGGNVSAVLEHRGYAGQNFLIQDETVASITAAGNLAFTSGRGIDFSATSGTGTSELFDDYEEGTWTPSLGGNTTYTVQEGYYVKVGSLVNVKATILVNTIGTGSVNTISGLPYTNGGGIAACNVAYWGTIATAVNHLVGTVTADGTTIVMRGVTTAASSVSTITTFQNSAYVELTATYSTLT